jgi:hypothetical protein
VTSYPYSGRLLTDAVLAACRVIGAFPVGDNSAPADGGWAGGVPNVGEFKAYAVVSSQGALASASPIGADRCDWDTTWLAGSYGGSREQCEWVADEIRKPFCDLIGTTHDLGGVTWKIMGTVFKNLGAVERIDTTDPPYWQVRDTVGLRITRQ